MTACWANQIIYHRIDLENELSFTATIYTQMWRWEPHLNAFRSYPPFLFICVRIFILLISNFIDLLIHWFIALLQCGKTTTSHWQYRTILLHSLKHNISDSVKTGLTVYYPSCFLVLATFIDVTWQTKVRHHWSIVFSQKYIACCQVSVDTLRQNKPSLVHAITLFHKIFWEWTVVLFGLSVD